MGVKHFYLWYKNNFSHCIVTKPKQVDTLAIDLNGVFHWCAQKVFRYGNSSALLLQKMLNHSNHKTNVLLFREICKKIEKLCQEIRPQKKLILCVDGVAGLGKMNQQRQRRFKTGLTMDNSSFNPNSFTPGTKLMDHLTKYVDWFIRSMMTNDTEWQNLEVVFSNEKVPGEGEHKIMQYVRNHEMDSTGTICIYGLDADLVMIGLTIFRDNVFIAREPDTGFIEYVSLSLFRKQIVELMRFPGNFKETEAVHDFILMSFLVGNDFLPTLPTISILDGAFDIFMEIYAIIGPQYGHLTFMDHKKIHFRLEALQAFFREFSFKEKELLEKKYNSQLAFFPDPLVLRNLKVEGQKNVIHFQKYREDYYHSKLKNVSLSHVVHCFIDGMDWVLNYYKFSIPDWTWFYPYFYGPFLVDLAEHIADYKPAQFVLHEPVDPFLQLLMVLPESSKSLLPNELSDVASCLKPFFPDQIEIDLTGKRKEWEGIVILPMVHLSAFEHFYRQREPKLSTQDKKRNIRGKNFLYKCELGRRELFSSFYGNIHHCPVRTIVFQL